jgi:hypothetical protein
MSLKRPVYSSLAFYDQHGSDTTSVTPSFKAKTECIPLCVSESSFTHKATSREINSITSLYYIVSYYKNLLQVQNGLSGGKDTILPQADDRGFTFLEEVSIKELLIF